MRRVTQRVPRCATGAARRVRLRVARRRSVTPGASRRRCCPRTEEEPAALLGLRLQGAARCSGASGARRAHGPVACVAAQPTPTRGSPVPVGVAHVPQAFAQASLAVAFEAVRGAARGRLRRRAGAAWALAAAASRAPWRCGWAQEHARSAVWVDDGLPSQVAAHVQRHGRCTRRRAAAAAPHARRREERRSVLAVPASEGTNERRRHARCGVQTKLGL